MDEKQSQWTKRRRAIAMLNAETNSDRLGSLHICDNTRPNNTSIVIESSSMSILQD